MTSTKEIKCVIWDLDNTLWDGIVLEGDEIQLKPGIPEMLETLDKRGVLHSIASRNDHELAMAKLQGFGIAEYFLFPEIHWNPKSTSVGRIQKNLNIGMDTVLFIDDQPFERDEVQSVHAGVTCVDAAEYRGLLDEPRLNPRYATRDSRRRRLMYLESIERDREEEEHEGPQEEFLASLEMRFIISEADEDDLQRAEELTVRTNQLNATAVTYSYEELATFLRSPDHQLLVCELTDRYGSYGKIGLSLVEMGEEIWHLRLLLMSCRVMSRGVGSVLLSHIMQQAREHGVRLLADFRHTDRNRMMHIAYRFADFTELSRDEDGRAVLENDLSRIQPFPSHLKVEVG